MSDGDTASDILYNRHCYNFCLHMKIVIHLKFGPKAFILKVVIYSLGATTESDGSFREFKTIV